MLGAVILMLAALGATARAETIAFPKVSCDSLTRSSCELYCGFTQLDIELNIGYPSEDFAIDFMCGSQPNDLLTCWACDQTGVMMSRPLVDGSTPQVNATLKNQMVRWAQICDAAWLISTDEAAKRLSKSTDNLGSYPVGYSCGSQYFALKGFDPATAGTPSSSPTLHAGGDDIPTSYAATIFSSRPAAAPANTASPTGPYSGGEDDGPVSGDAPAGGEGAAQRARSLSGLMGAGGIVVGALVLAL